jgi:hypothetical protein
VVFEVLAGGKIWAQSEQKILKNPLSYRLTAIKPKPSIRLSKFQFDCNFYGHKESTIMVGTPARGKVSQWLKK